MQVISTDLFLLSHFFTGLGAPRRPKAGLSMSVSHSWMNYFCKAHLSGKKPAQAGRLSRLRTVEV